MKYVLDAPQDFSVLHQAFKRARGKSQKATPKATVVTRKNTNNTQVIRGRGCASSVRDGSNKNTVVIQPKADFDMQARFPQSRHGTCTSNDRARNIERSFMGTPIARAFLGGIKNRILTIRIITRRQGRVFLSVQCVGNVRIRHTSDEKG